ncbi:MAG: hypothetical protein PWP65_966 [Clostridia bacterium]|nr:hypothetical protein [Clostridia bacterium]
MDSTIIRTEKRDAPFVLIDKAFLADDRLSWKAKGLLAYFLSKPSDWRIYISDLVKQSKDGRDAVYAGLSELEKCGYLQRRKIRDKQGKIIGWENIVYERPIKKADPNPDFPEMVEQPLPDFPDTGNPDTENPDTEKPTLLNNDSTNNDFTNKEQQQHKQHKTQIDVVVADSQVKKPGFFSLVKADPKVQEVVKLVQNLAGQEITPATARALFKIADGDLGRIERAAEALAARLQVGGRVNSVEAWLVAATRDGYAPERPAARLPTASRKHSKHTRRDKDKYADLYLS